MAFPRLALLLWKQRLWHSTQLSLLNAVAIVGALACVVWLEQQHTALQLAKQQITLTLILEPQVSSEQVAILARDLQMLAPTLVRQIEPINDSMVAERLQNRYGIALSDLVGDSLFPRLLRVYFRPEYLTQSSFTAFVEQCQVIEGISTLHYPLSRTSSLFEQEHRYRLLRGILLIGWVGIVTIGIFMHLRALPPLSRHDAKTLILMGASPMGVRRCRVYYFTLSAVVGFVIAAAVTITAWLFHTPLFNDGKTLAAAGMIAAAATLIIGSLLSASVTAA